LRGRPHSWLRGCWQREKVRCPNAHRSVGVSWVRSGGACEELVEGLGAFFHDGAELVEVDEAAGLKLAVRSTVGWASATKS
jgi:hypothetical protein